MISERKTVLIVEDDLDLQSNLHDILEFNGYKTLLASNGYEGYKVALVGEPDIIISDIRMPQMDGLELLNKLQDNPITSLIPFVFLTAKVEVQDIRTGMALGADDYITKPFRIDDVLRTITSRLKKKETQFAFIQDFKNNLIKNVAHELRTPLVSIIGFSEIIGNTFKNLSEEEIIKLAHNINKSGKSLNYKIEKFLLYAELLAENKINAPQVKVFEVDPQKIKEVIEKKASEYERNGDITIDIQKGKIEFKPELFSLILSELLDNALKFSIEGTPINVSVECKGRYYIIHVINKGSGINSKKFDNIDAFTLVNFQEKNHEGAGLGLTLIKKITNLYNGYINIDTETDDYTKIEVGLPLVGELQTKVV